MTALTDTQVITASGGLVELGYLERISNLSLSTGISPATSELVIGSISAVCDGSPVEIEFFASDCTPASGSGNYLAFSLYVDGVEQTQVWGFFNNQAASTNYNPVFLKRRIVPSAGVHTFAVRAYSVAAGGFIEMRPGGADRAPGYLRVSKIVQATQWPAVTTGTIICTSSTRPASPFAGQQIYETNTLSFQVWNGTYWSQVWPQTFVTASDTTTQDGAASNNFVYATATITLTPGVWLVQGMAHLVNLLTSDDTAVGLYNATTSAEVSNSRGPAGTTTTTSSASLMSRLVSMTVSANTNIRVFCTRNGGSTIRAYSTSGSPAAALWAQKVG